MGAFLQELFHTGLYKRTQGRITRQVTFAVLAVSMGIAMWQLSQTMVNWQIVKPVPWLQYAVPGGLLAMGIWAVYRLVNVPEFADFLIAVEAEMNKVSWPTRAELFRASLVVLFTIFVLAALLAIFDLTWRAVFQALGVL